MSAREQHDVTGAVARFVLRADWAGFPAGVKHECVRAVTNGVGCIIGGARHDMVEVARRALRDSEGRGRAKLLGRAEATDALSAALLNGVAGAAYSFDDNYADAMLHPSVPVLSALFAASGDRQTSGSAFLLACAVGLEVACRTTSALTVPPAEAEIGWSQTGVAAGIGAAAAVGNLIQLDEARLISAIGIAAAEAAGFRATHGSMAASLIFGRAAQSGVRACLLAREGFTGPGNAFEHKFGLLAGFSKKPNPAALTHGLGKYFELLKNTYKPFPCGLVIHPSIDAVLQLRSKLNVPAEEVAAVELIVSPQAQVFGAFAAPRNELEAKTSLHHWAAAAIVTGAAGLAQGAADMLARPDIVDLRSRIVVTASPARGNESAEARFMLRNGERHALLVEHCVGSRERPMTDEELSQKFLGQAVPVIGAERAAGVLQSCWRIEQLRDVSEILV